MSTQSPHTLFGLNPRNDFSSLNDWINKFGKHVATTVLLLVYLEKILPSILHSSITWVRGRHPWQLWLPALAELRQSTWCCTSDYCILVYYEFRDFFFACYLVLQHEYQMRMEKPGSNCDVARRQHHSHGGAKVFYYLLTFTLNIITCLYLLAFWLEIDFCASL